MSVTVSDLVWVRYFRLCCGWYSFSFLAIEPTLTSWDLNFLHVHIRLLDTGPQEVKNTSFSNEIEKRCGGKTIRLIQQRLLLNHFQVQTFPLQRRWPLWIWDKSIITGCYYHSVTTACAHTQIVRARARSTYHFHLSLCSWTTSRHHNL